MENLRLKQIGLVLCLMASLLVGSVSACACSHHQEKKVEVETSCHRSHEQAESNDDAGEQAATDTQSVDAGCLCYMSLPVASIAAATDNKTLKIVKDLVSPADAAVLPKFEAVAIYETAALFFFENTSYHGNVSSLLPARAPPRL